MKIELEEPFRSEWKYGYLVVNKEPRRNVILYNSKDERTTISYARYLYSVFTGEIVPPDVVVDHINGDQMDDRLENYQLLSLADNNRKSVRQNGLGRAMVEFRCGICGVTFHKERRNTHLAMTRKSTDFCSRQCAGRGIYLGIRSDILSEYSVSHT